MDGGNGASLSLRLQSLRMKLTESPRSFFSEKDISKVICPLPLPSNSIQEVSDWRQAAPGTVKCVGRPGRPVLYVNTKLAKLPPVEPSSSGHGASPRRGPFWLDSWDQLTWLKGFPEEADNKGEADDRDAADDTDKADDKDAVWMAKIQSPVLAQETKPWVYKGKQAPVEPCFAIGDEEEDNITEEVDPCFAVDDEEEDKKAEEVDPWVVIGLQEEDDDFGLSLLQPNDEQDRTDDFGLPPLHLTGPYLAPPSRGARDFGPSRMVGAVAEAVLRAYWEK